MRLLESDADGNFSLAEFQGDKIPPYAILSHTWGEGHEEITFEDIQSGTGRRKAGFAKLDFCRQQAAKDGLIYFWIDTCAIDKKNAVELSEAINSMFRWYRDAAKCYVYLSDVSTVFSYPQQTRNPAFSLAESSNLEGISAQSWLPQFRNSRWFTRGWTLQELVAPRVVEFFSVNGELLGSRNSLLRVIRDATGIAEAALQGSTLERFSIDERMSWASNRQTEKEEDAAYSLLGICNVFMPPIYGEGRDNALKRLRKEILETKKLSQVPEEILQWLGSPDPQLNFEKALKARQAGTGQWFLESEPYYKWKRNPSKIWLHGIPGCGKTVLSSSIIQDVLEHCSESCDRSRKVGYFYFDFNDQEKQNPRSMITSLVSQLLVQTDGLPLELQALHTSCISSRRQASTDNLLEVLHLLIKNTSHTFVILDALDESESREDLLEIVERLAGWHRDGLHLCLTSRRERAIELALTIIIDKENTINIQNDRVDRDIETFVEQSLLHDKKLTKWNRDAKIRQDIANALTEGANGMFRWVACQLDSIKHCRSKRKLYDTLKSLPPTLDATYDQLLLAINKDDVDYALNTLKWLAFSTRPMLVKEVAELVAIDLGRTPAFDRMEVLEDPFDIVDICSSLVVITESDSTSLAKNNVVPPKQSIVSLAHYSVKEYLTSSRIRNSISAKFVITAESGHQLLARSCIYYLAQLHVFDTHAIALRKQPAQIHLDHALAGYAARNWMRHARHVQIEESKFWAEVCNFLASESSMMTWLVLYEPVQLNWALNKANEENRTPRLPAVFWAAHTDLLPAVDLLIREGADVNARCDCDPRYALAAATLLGHEDVVRLLLEKGANVHPDDEVDNIAVVNASGRGWKGLVKLLIDHGYNIHAENKYGNALCVASLTGEDGIVRLLLDRGADVHALSGHTKWPALSAASYYGHESIVRLLLENGADVNAVDGSLRHPLHAACEGREVGVARLLLDNGAEINASNDKSDTALHVAVNPPWRVNLELIDMLLEYGADINASGKGGTVLELALKMAAEDASYIPLVKKLRERGAAENGGTQVAKDVDEC